MSNSQHLPLGKSGSKIDALFVLARQEKASDLYLAANNHPALKVHGKLKKLTEYPIIKAKRIEDLFYSVLTQKQQQDFENRMEIELTYETEAAGNIQVILYLTEEGVGAACRLIPISIPSLEAIGPVDPLEKIAALDRGLVLITGKTNSGKAITMASIIDHINTHLQKGIVTIEDPIRFAYKSKSSLIFQREVGLHTLDYSGGIRTAMQSDMDVILFTEIDGPETLTTAMNAAESHLVLTSSISFGGSEWAIRKLFDFFPEDRQAYVRTHLSRVLKALIWQHLVPVKDNTGTETAMEIMFTNEKIAAMIQNNQLHKVRGEIEKGAGGMQTMNSSVSRIGGAALLDITKLIAADIGTTLLFAI